MSLQWSQSARRAMSIFYTKWNDIDVFIEDTAAHAESLYAVIINRLLDGKAHVKKVFPLGGRAKVVEACRQDTSPDGRPRIYLIDGDLDLLAGVSEPEVPRLFQHRVYAIENYLLCEDALVELLHEENPRCSIETIKQKLNYKEWVNSVAGVFDLFVIFGASKILTPELPTISLTIGAFISGSPISYLDIEKINDFCTRRRLEILAIVDEDTLEATKEAVIKRIEAAQCPFDIVAGRDFIFPLLRFWIKGVGLSLKATNETMQLRLAKVVSFDRHSEYREAVRRTATVP